MRKYIVFLLGCLFLFNAKAQNDSLLMIGDVPVSRSEFIYAYQKNNSTSFDNFLSQYVRVKRWAYAAKELGLDTTYAFVSRYSLYKHRLEGELVRMQRENGNNMDTSYLAHLFVRIPQKTSYKYIDNLRCGFDSLYQHISENGEGLSKWIQANKDSLPENWSTEVLKVTSSRLVNDFLSYSDSLEEGILSRPFFSPVGIHMVQIVDSIYHDCNLATSLRFHDENWLLSEYQDGLLTQMLEDSICSVNEEKLEKYYNKHRKQYKWKYPHFKGIILQSSDEVKLENLERCLNDYPQDMWIKIIKQLSLSDNLSWLKVDYGLFQIGTNACVDKLYFGQGKFKPLTDYPYVKVLGKVLKKKPESYMDVYEKVKSDFCKSQIEKEDAFLKKKIKVEINEEVLKTVNNHEAI